MELQLIETPSPRIFGNSLAHSHAFCTHQFMENERGIQLLPSSSHTTKLVNASNGPFLQLVLVQQVAN